jgi:NAD(P)-dependent dehydrogenase (short-subunit alcohol dehydrogenase family)
MMKFSAQFRNLAALPRPERHGTCSLHTHFRATTVIGETDTASARPAHNTKLEDQLMARLVGKVAVITGGSSGIGLATAQRFVDEGAHVFIMGRRRSELDKAKALIGEGLSTVAGDVTNSADLDKLFATVLDKLGGLDILVANSARVEPEMLGKITEENFDATFNLNARATLFTVQKALPLIRNGGSVILIGSAAGRMGVPGYSAYSATKAALRSYTRTWTREFNDRGIRFNTLSPGPIDTPMLDRQPDKAQFAAAVPLNRLGRPEEIAAAALFLASGDSSFVAGVELSVDGGMAQV